MSILKGSLGETQTGVNVVKDSNGINDSIRMVFLNPSHFLLQNEIKNIPPMFEGCMVPNGFINDIAYWGGNMPDDEIIEKLPDGTRKLTHLELDFGSTWCAMHCPHCFKSHNEMTIREGMSLGEIETMISEKFEPLGLKTIKICGPGEPFQNSMLLPFLKWAHNKGLGVSIFTKGYEIGDDDVVNKKFGIYGVHTGEELVKKLKEYDVSILLGLNSFDPQKQKEFVGHGEDKFGEKYIKAQKKAMVLLINAGLNEFKPGCATRLGISFAPMKPETLDDAYELYKWARMRNIYPLGCPSNDSGDGQKENERISSEFDNYEEDLLNLYIKIYIWNIEHGIQTLENFLEEGPSLYPGVHICKQARTGGYIRLNESGTYEMVSCPGHDPKRPDLMIVEDVLNSAKEEIADLWKKSGNASRGKYFCIARSGITLSIDFPSKVIEGVKRYFNIE